MGGQNRLEAKDISRYVSSVSRNEVTKLNGRLEEGRTRILMPVEFYNSTLEMCRTEKESRGVILVPKNPQKEGQFLVQAMIIIGSGTSTSVYPDDAKVDAFNKLLREHASEVQPIDFHTHTQATASGAGPYYLQNFSGGDFSSIANNVNRASYYKHVLFTPTTVLTFGLDMPQFGVASFKQIDPYERQAYWQGELNKHLRR